MYLLNCASEDKEIRDKSRQSLIQSLRVGHGIGAVGVVLHPGSAKQGDVPKAIKRAGKVIKEALAESEACALHLEDTAGAGGTLGRSFEELAELLDAAGGGKRLGLCLDSCHLLASGYDVGTAQGLRDTLAECDRIVGLDRLHSLHLNDSMTPLGSNRDRHAILGEGELGERGCAVFLSEPRFEKLPCVLETGTDGGAPSAADVEHAFKLRSARQALPREQSRRDDGNEPRATGPALDVKGLHKRYGQIVALGGVELTVGRGELVGLLGPNGAGKSTLVKIACGLVRATSGTASVCGAPAGSRPARGSIGYLAELFRFPGWCTAEEVLALHQRLARSDGGARERAELLELVGLVRGRVAPRRRDVEGHAAAARDRAGADRRAAAAAARRADERARSGRAAGGADAARGAALARDRGAARTRTC